MDGQEIEVKFLLADLAAFRARLMDAGAALTGDRVHEINLRFDLPDRALTQQHKVLRLRKDRLARLTFKGPAQAGQSVTVRTEIEVEVSDFEAAKRLLEALGYEVSVMYEKYRTTFQFDHAEIVIDELPFGNFVEIEAGDAAAVQSIAFGLALRWEARITESYLALFSRLQTNLGTHIRDLSFADLRGIAFTPADLGIAPGDH